MIILLNYFFVNTSSAQEIFVNTCTIGGNVYRIAIVDLSQQTITPIHNIPNNFGVSDITMDKAGNFYVTDHKHLLKVIPVTNPLPPPNWNYVSYDTLATIPSSTSYGGIVSLAIDCNEKIFLGDLDNQNIWTYDLHSGHLVLLGTYNQIFFDFEFFDGMLLAHCYEFTSGWGRTFLMNIHLDDLSVMDTIMEVENNGILYPSKTAALASDNRICNSVGLYAPRTGHFISYNLNDSTYNFIDFPGLCAGGATSATSWLGSYTPLDIDAVDVKSEAGDCSPPFSITAHIRKGYYMRPDIQFSLDGINFQSDSTFTGLSPGKYVVHVQDSFGCYKHTDSIELQLHSFHHEVSETPDYCGQQNGTALISAGNGNMLSTDGINFVPDSIRLSALQAGVYTYFVRNASGCIDTASVVIQGSGGVAIHAVDITNPDCNASDGLIQVSASGDTLTFALAAQSNHSGIFTGLDAGTYTLVITDAFGCQSDTLITLVGTNAAVIEHTSIEDAHCNENNGQVIVSLQGTEAVEISTDGIHFMAGTLVDNLPQGMHTLYIRNEQGCITLDTIHISQTGVPLFTAINIVDVACEDNNGTFSFIPVGHGPFILTLNGQLYSDPLFENLPAGTYSAAITDVFGCKAEQQIDIKSSEVTGSPALTTLAAHCSQPFGILAFQGFGPDIYYEIKVTGKMYAPGDTVHLPAGQTTIAMHYGDCVKDTTVTILRENCPYFIPNVFTPNNDQVNDAFRIEGQADVLEMRIFDRWGACLFVSSDPMAAWDGSFQNQTVPPGVYVYWIKVRMPDGSEEVRKGDVTVVR